MLLAVWTVAHSNLTLCSPGKFSMADFVRVHAQNVTAEIYPVQLIVMDPHWRDPERRVTTYPCRSLYALQMLHYQKIQ